MQKFFISDAVVDVSLIVFKKKIQHGARRNLFNLYSRLVSGSTCDRAIVNISHIREICCNSRYRAIVIPARGVIPARRLVFNSAS
ncbi:MAG: hypothetical protein ACI90V_000846, partial [Bacillariaceae sp.]